MSHILLLPFGTLGSVYPFIWLGRRLLESGHRVSMVASPIYERTALAAGIEFFNPEPDELSQMLLDPELWQPRSSNRVAFTYGGRATAPCVSAVERLILEIGRPDLMFAPMISFGARLVREKHGIPLVTVHLYPAVMMSSDDAPLVFPSVLLIRMLPLAVRKFIFSLPSPYDRFALPLVAQACIDHGVEPPRRLWKSWHQSPDGVLALFPSWFARVERDHPDHTLQWDFPMEDLVDQRGLEAGLEAFLAAGAKPVLFTAGTGQYHAAHFFETAAKVVSKLGCRAVFLTTKPEQVPENLPDSVFVSAYAPFSLIIPRAVLMVHHGGIGTVSQCFAAGIPQLVVHMSLDQPDNAARVKRLGVGLSLGIELLTEKRLLSLVKRCLDCKSIKERAAFHAGHFQHRQPVAALIAWLEEIISRARPS